MIEKYRTTGARKFETRVIGKDFRGHKITEAFEYFNTAEAGPMKLEAWYEAVKAAAVEDGLSELLERIKKHCRKNCAWLRTEQQIEEYALECLSNEAYKYWDDLKEGNAR